MFTEKPKGGNIKEAETIIGPSVRVQGDFVGQGNVIVEGVVKGSVKTKGDLKVGEQAKINASISANNAIISGEIKGNIDVQGDLELTAQAKVFGDINAKTINIARGAILNGNCKMGGVEESMAKEDKKDEKK